MPDNDRRLTPQAIPRRGARPPGRPTERVYADPVREHVAQLLEDDTISAADIARASGVNPTTVRTLAKLVTMQRWSAEAILQVTAESARAAQFWRDVTPAREHLLRILEQEDCTTTALVAASGMDDRQIREVLSGFRTRIKPDTERILLGLNAYVVRRNAALVNQRRAVTRLRALQANGHSTYELGRRLGTQKTPYFLGSSSKTRQITQEMDRRVEALYNEIGDKPGPSLRAAAIARRLGYYPPIHYDEDMRLIRESIPGKHWEPVTPPEDRARISLRILGLTLKEHTSAEIAPMVGYSVKKVERTRSEIGIRLENNAHASVLLPFFLPGQDELLALIARHVDGIALGETQSIIDTPGLDYVALWESLVAGAERLRAEIEAWEEHERRKSWIPPLGVSWVA